MEVKSFLNTKEVFEIDPASSETHKMTLNCKIRLIMDDAM